MCMLVGKVIKGGKLGRIGTKHSPGEVFLDMERECSWCFTTALLLVSIYPAEAFVDCNQRMPFSQVLYKHPASLGHLYSPHFLAHTCHGAQTHKLEEKVCLWIAILITDWHKNLGKKYHSLHSSELCDYTGLGILASQTETPSVASDLLIFFIRIC